MVWSLFKYCDDFVCIFVDLAGYWQAKHKGWVHNVSVLHGRGTGIDLWNILEVHGCPLLFSVPEKLQLLPVAVRFSICFRFQIAEDVFLICSSLIYFLVLPCIEASVWVRKNCEVIRSFFIEQWIYRQQENNIIVTNVPCMCSSSEKNH